MHRCDPRRLPGGSDHQLGRSCSPGRRLGAPFAPDDLNCCCQSSFTAGFIQIGRRERQRRQFPGPETIPAGYGSLACRRTFLSRAVTIKSRQSGGFAQGPVVAATFAGSGARPPAGSLGADAAGPDHRVASDSAGVSCGMRRSPPMAMVASGGERWPTAQPRATSLSRL